MFKYREHVYRRADTFADIPSWEDVWEYAKNYDATVHREESYMMNLDEDNTDDMTLATQLTKEDVYEQYQNIEWLLRNYLDGKDCWREMKLDRVNPATLNPIGIYWSYEKEKAEAHGGVYGQTVLYRARIDLENIDIPYTVAVHVDLDTGPQEAEVGFHQGFRIWVYDVTLDDGTVVPIRNWRRC